MSTNCLLPTRSVSTDVSTLTSSASCNKAKPKNNSSSSKTTGKTDQLSRSFLDDKNAKLFAKTRLISLRVKKFGLDQEITKYHDMRLQYRGIEGLEMLCDLYTQYLTDLMREFLEVTQEITHLNNLLR